ncbi:hypothetical protein CSV69_02090 [Sporosarcina sp. P26b]|nr:hypothetical protein SporoP32a_14080 [Sporosarcina ureae]PIC97018.1 hypothetical protein CSV69_02090 [Sporosarcina sp. P26b]
MAKMKWKRDVPEIMTGCLFFCLDYCSYENLKSKVLRVMSEFVSGSGWKLQLADAFPWALGEPTRSRAPFWLSHLSS